MPKKIIYFVETYAPDIEAISKEIRVLQKNFASKMYDVMSKKFIFSNKLVSFNCRKFPFGLLTLPFFENRRDISHIYTSLGNRLYLRLLSKKPIILTGAGASSKEKIKKCLPFYRKLSKIIVESEKDKKTLLTLGVNKRKLHLIYPGINLKKFKYGAARGKFKILFASSPMQESHFHSRGIYLLIEAIKELEEFEFIFLWRGRYSGKIKKKIAGIKNIKLIDKRLAATNKVHKQVHATILPFTTYLGTKPCPHSAIESIASGKPILVTDVSGIFDVVKEEKCGVVVRATKTEIVKGIRKLKKDYKKLQGNCLKTARKHFDENKFINKYKEIYESL